MAQAPDTVQVDLKEEEEAMVHQVHMVEEDLPLPRRRKDRLQVQTLSAHSNQIEVSYFSLRRLHARLQVMAVVWIRGHRPLRTHHS